MGSAADFLPERTTLPAMREAVQGCRGCELYEDTTQAVFGEGPEDARVVMVGEQPGDKEDLAGRPFVGPAGGMLDRAIEEAGLLRDEVYITNVVKHFSHVVRGKRYLDMLAAYSALNFGHRHPDLIRAANEQLDRLTLTSRAFPNDRFGPFCEA